MKKIFLFIFLFFISHLIFSQKKDINQYFKIFQQTEEKKLNPSNNQKITFTILTTKNSTNFLEANAKDVSNEGEIHLKSYQMRVFETKNKKNIIVVFGMNCWTGCVSNINEMYFFDENMKDITKKILPQKKIIDYFKKFVKKEVQIENAFLADFYDDNGTIKLYLSAHYLTIKEQEIIDNTAFLVFDAKKGTFNFVEQISKK
ncbi:MAG: hypothetical protein EAZ85_07860 [Bacteroidetes bacterium]|nr:MAG: hypothetical protein EAZ85_07860 [Bacteroidota bacterium]TAG88173.1 MAG: hypothetical protein EAZ20_09105 [Bacteroidota bacterium]